MKPLFLAVLLMASSAPLASQDSIFRDGFESGDTFGWTSSVGLRKRIIFTEILANQSGPEATGAGEFLEVINLGMTSIDLEFMELAIGPEGALVRDQIMPYDFGPTIVPPGGYAVVLDPQYDGRFAFRAGTVLARVYDTAFGAAGLATTHWVQLFDVDGTTLLDEFRYPSDPGDGVSLHRIDLIRADDAANWAATPCGSTPGDRSCPDTVDVSTFTSFWVDRDAGEDGVFWHQAIGWPQWHDWPCSVCPGGSTPYTYWNNLPAAQPFTFTNLYADYSVVFTERANLTDDCGGPQGGGCTGASVQVPPRTTVEVPASSLGYYYAQTVGPELNTLDWWDGNPESYRQLPPDGTLRIFSVEATQP